MTQRGAVSEAYCPDPRCTPQAGMRKIVAAQWSGTWRREGCVGLVCLSGRSDLPFIGAREGDERLRVVHGKNLDIGAAEEERAWISLLFSCSDK